MQHMYSGILGDPGAVSGGGEKSKNGQGNVFLFNWKRHAKFQALLQKKEKHLRLSLSMVLRSPLQLTFSIRSQLVANGKNLVVKSGKYDIDYMLLCSCEFCDILIQGLHVNIVHEINSVQLLSWVEGTLLWLQRRQQNPQVHMLAVFVVLILKFQYISSWKGCSWQNLPCRSFENTSWCWTGSTSWKSSRKWETASFCLC